MSILCHDSDCAVADDCGGGSPGGEIMLFGVRVKVDPMRKSVSMNDLSQYEQPHEPSNVAADVSAAGYASADEAVQHQGSGFRDRKRGIPWTVEEHKLFLLGLQKVGKGDWKGISRNFVKTRTPTQVASHAQKHFLRRTNLNRRRRRCSLFDITTESVTAVPMEEEKAHQESKTQGLLSPTQPPPPESSNITGSPLLPFPASMGPVLIPVQIGNPMQNVTQRRVGQVNHHPLILPVRVLPLTNASTFMGANLTQKSPVDPSQWSLRLSQSSDQNQPSRHSGLQVMSRFNNGDSIISVA